MVEKSSRLNKLKDFRQKRTVVVTNCNDENSLQAVCLAVKSGVAEPILTGNEFLIQENLKKLGEPNLPVTIINAENDNDALQLALECIHKGKGDILMKGLISTDLFMKGVLDKNIGLLEKGELLSHITIMDIPNYHKLLFISDVAVVPLPSLAQKQVILKRLIAMANSLGVKKPKIGLIAATEKLIARMPACSDAIEIKKEWMEGKHRNCIIEGPLGLDLAIDMASALAKKYNSPVSGDCDCLLFPNIESGNVFYKTCTKWLNAETAAMLNGTSVPVVLSSRGDTVFTKYYSILLASRM